MNRYRLNNKLSLISSSQLVVKLNREIAGKDREAFLRVDEPPPPPFFSVSCYNWSWKQKVISKMRELVLVNLPEEEFSSVKSRDQVLVQCYKYCWKWISENHEPHCKCSCYIFALFFSKWTNAQLWVPYVTYNNFECLPVKTINRYDTIYIRKFNNMCRGTALFILMCYQTHVLVGLEELLN